MTSLHLPGGGFHSFWYHLGYIRRLRELHGPSSWPCGGSSAGCLAAWVLAHEQSSKEFVLKIALELQKTHSWCCSLDTWVVRFMTLVSSRCGSFNPHLYTGAYVTTLTNRTPTLLRSPNPSLDIRASCFIPILSGGLLAPGGWVDGCLGWPPTLSSDIRCVPFPVNGYVQYAQCLLPLTRHVKQYEIGLMDASIAASSYPWVPVVTHVNPLVTSRL